MAAGLLVALTLLLFRGDGKTKDSTEVIGEPKGYSAVAIEEEDNRVKAILRQLEQRKPPQSENGATNVQAGITDGKPAEKPTEPAAAPKVDAPAKPAAKPRKSRWKPPPVPDRADTSEEEQAKHKLAIIVPYRDREANLKEFLPIVTEVCLTQNIKFRIFIVEQTELGAFNRAKLCNIGFSLAMAKSYDYVVFHDVDKVPLSANVSYRWPGEGMVHMASCVEQFDFKLPYYSFLGGVVMFRGDHYRRFNGMGNFFWGWGAEDDDTWVRMKRARIRLTRAKSCEAGRFRSLAHLSSKYHYPKVEYNANYKIYRELLKRRRKFQDDGLSTLTYKLISNQSYEHHDYIVVDVCQGNLGRKTPPEAGCDGAVLVDPTATTVAPTATSPASAKS